MKKWVLQNKAYVIGAVLGGLAGVRYWPYVGCLTGTCALSSKPLNSTLDFGLMGTVLLAFFRKPASEKSNFADEGKL